MAPLQVQGGPENGKSDDDLYKEYPAGYYADGAYTAIPHPSATAMRNNTVLADEEEDSDPQIAYYTSLSTRFSKLRGVLQSMAQATDISNTADNKPAPVISSLYGATHATWRYTLLHTAPLPYTLIALPQGTVVRGLQVVETLLTRRNLADRSTVKLLGAWCWGLLGKCRAVGEMGSEDVGILRLLGKRAVWLLRGLQVGRQDGEEEENDRDEEGGDDQNGEPFQGGEVAGDDICMDEEQENGEIVGESEHEHDQFGIQDGEPKYPADGQASTAIPSETPNQHAEQQYPIQPSPSTLLDPLSFAKEALLSKLQPQKSTDIPQNIASQHRSTPITTPSLPNPDGPPSASSQDQHSSTDAESLAIGELETRASLDMIVTIVGEFYGQRDLLEGRDVWGE